MELVLARRDRAWDSRGSDRPAGAIDRVSTTANLFSWRGDNTSGAAGGASKGVCDVRITESSRRGKVKDGARRQWSDSKKRGVHLTARCAHGLLRFACERRGDNGKVNEARVAFQRMPLYF